MVKSPPSVNVPLAAAFTVSVVIIHKMTTDANSLPGNNEKGMTPSVRALMAGLIDYAGMFPPAALDLNQAVANYQSYSVGQFHWILGRFVELDVPEPLPDYASSAAMRIVAWFDLNHVKDSTGQPKAQYLLLGTKGGEGQPCDFTSVRVYTWGVQRNRYETAFVDGGFCGKLPVALNQNTGSPGDVTFSFADLSGGKSATRTYKMHQTIVRRVRQPGETSPHKHAQR